MPPPVQRRSHVAPLPRISRFRAVLATGAISFVVAVVIFGGLALQMALGNDPAIGPGTNQGSSKEAGDSPASTAVSQPIVIDPNPQPAPVAIPTPAPVQSSVS